MTFNAILGHYNQNSYVGLEQANEYFEYNTEYQRWALASNDAKKRFLSQASMLLNRLPAFAPGNPFLWEEPYKQALRLPLADHLYVNGTADSGTQFKLIDSALASTSDYRTDFFKYGSIRAKSGTNLGLMATILTFDVSTGQVGWDVSQQWTEAVAADDTYTILYPLAKEIVEAVCDLAIEVQKGGFVEMFNTSGIPAHVRNKLNNWLSYTGNVRAV